jgi:hypothetical protein
MHAFHHFIKTPFSYAMTVQTTKALLLKVEHQRRRIPPFLTGGEGIREQQFI